MNVALELAFYLGLTVVVVLFVLAVAALR